MPGNTETYLSPEIAKQFSDINDTLSLLKQKEALSTVDSARIKTLERELERLKNAGVTRTIVESHIVEKTLAPTVSSGADEQSVNQKISELKKEISSQLALVSSKSEARSAANFQAIALSNKIDNLKNVTVSGVSGLTNSDIPDDVTASNYLPLSGGAISGSLSVSASTTFNGVEYLFPSADGTSGQFLGTNSRGGLSWNTVPQIFTDGGNTTYLVAAGDNVAIGTTTAYSKFSVWGNGVAGGRAFEIADSASTTRFAILDNGTTGIGSSSPSVLLSVGGSAYVGTSSYSTLTIHAGLVNYPISATTTIAGQTNAFAIATSTSAFPLISFDGLHGRIGLATSTPFGFLSLDAFQATSTPTFYVKSGTDQTANLFTFANSTSSSLFALNPDGSLSLTNASSTSSIFSISSASSTASIFSITASSTADFISLTQTGSGGLFKIGTTSLSTAFYIDASGRVGIGTTTPQARLEVAGNIKLSGDAPTYTVLNVSTPTASSSVATKGYVDAAQGGANKSSSLGADMMTAYFDSQGYFTPHANTCSGTEAYRTLYSGASVGFCIEKDERAAQTWENARITCAAAGKRLPEFGEWKDVCKNASTTLSVINMINDYEWASNFAIPESAGGVFSVYAGGAGCGSANAVGASYNGGSEGSYTFRCAH